MGRCQEVSQMVIADAAKNFGTLIGLGGHLLRWNAPRNHIRCSFRNHVAVEENIDLVAGDFNGAS